MGDVVDVNPIFKQRALRATGEEDLALRIASRICARLGILPSGDKYAKYISPLPSKDHREAVIQWALGVHPERLLDGCLANDRYLAERLDVEIRKAIPDSVFWAHE